MKNVNKTRLAWVAEIVCYILFVAAVLVGIHYYEGGFESEPTPIVLQAQQPLTPAQKADRHLHNTDVKSADAANRNLARITAIFHQARGGAKPYAEEVLSWGGKGVLLAQALDDIGTLFGDPKTTRHERYLKQQFERLVLQPDTLQTEITKALQAYISELDAAEAEMLVKLRADVFQSALADEATPAAKLDEAFKAEYEKRIQDVANEIIKATGQELLTFIASEAIAQIATDVCLSAAANLGISTTLIGGGALSSVATVGVGILVGLVVDQIIAAILKDTAYDPEIRVANAVKESLNKLEAALVKPLFEQVKKIHDTRATLRRTTIAKMMSAGGLE